MLFLPTVEASEQNECALCGHNGSKPIDNLWEFPPSVPMDKPRIFLPWQETEAISVRARYSCPLGHMVGRGHWFWLRRISLLFLKKTRLSYPRLTDLPFLVAKKYIVIVKNEIFIC